MNSLQIANEYPDVSKTASPLWVADVAGALASPDASVDPCRNSFGLFVDEFFFDASCCVTKAIANEYIILGGVLLVHPLPLIDFKKVCALS